MVTLTQLIKNAFQKLSRPAKRPIARTKLALEMLEGRVLLASYLWTGDSGMGNNWSTASNWKKDGFIATTTPTSLDDVVFNNTAMILRDSVVDANFVGGAVKSITLSTTYTKTLRACPISWFKRLLDSESRHRPLWVPTD